MKLLIHTTTGLLQGMWMTLLLSSLVVQPASAQGVPAGTVISNVATVSYSTNNLSNTTETVEASNSFVVAETINAVLTSLDNRLVVVPTPATNKTLTWQLTNTGNGTEGFVLNTIDTLNGDDFNPVVQSIWLESNNIPGLQSTDTPYQTGNILSLASDQSRIIYIQSNIPGQLNKEQSGHVKLTATATTPGVAGTNPGHSIPGAGDANTDAVVLIADGQTQGVSGYTVSTVALQLSKTVASIVDPFSGTEVMSQSRITYQIKVAVTGDANGTLEDLVIEDTTPANMEYVPGSITLNNQPLTDVADNDNADFNITENNTVTVNLGSLAPPAIQTITITYKVN